MKTGFIRVDLLSTRHITLGYIKWETMFTLVGIKGLIKLYWNSVCLFQIVKVHGYIYI